jgi:dTDP-4-amino-4,6-dideoxygalactose transaminase
MHSIHILGEKYGFKIIEDASHAIGGKYKNKPVGNGHYSDITVFSFHPVKIITTGEGGMAVTNDENLAQKLRLLRSHGISSLSTDMLPRPTDEIWNYQQIGLGFNYRMTDIQAALGISQIDRLDDFIKRRHQIAQCYDKAFEALSVTSPQQHADTWSSYHLYPIRINQGVCGVTQRQVYDFMQKADFNVNLHYIPVYRQPYYEAMGFKAGYCREAEEYYKETLSIPIYPALTDTDQARVIDVLHEVLS